SSAMERVFFGISASWSDGVHRKNVIHRSRAVPLSVECDVEEAEGPQSGSDLVEHLEAKGAGQLGARDLNTGQIAVMPHAHLPEAEHVKSVLCLLNLGEIFWGDGVAVFDPGGEAG